jgi:hypothetical protein
MLFPLGIFGVPGFLLAGRKLSPSLLRAVDSLALAEPVGLSRGRVRGWHSLSGSTEGLFAAAAVGGTLGGLAALALWLGVRKRKKVDAGGNQLRLPRSL